MLLDGMLIELRSTNVAHTPPSIDNKIEKKIATKITNPNRRTQPTRASHLLLKSDMPILDALREHLSDFFVTHNIKFNPKILHNNLK